MFRSIGKESGESVESVSPEEEENLRWEGFAEKEGLKFSKYFCSYLGVDNRVYELLTAVPSVLWRCWLGGRKGTRPVKTEWWGAGMVICLERGADLHMAQLMPLTLTVSCFSRIQIAFTFLVPAHPGSPDQSPWFTCGTACKWSHGGDFQKTSEDISV